MKKAIPTPITVVVIILAVVGLGFGIFKMASGPPEFAPPNVDKTIPGYVFSTMKPAMQKKMLDQGYKVVEGAPAAPTQGVHHSTPDQAGPTSNPYQYSGG